MSLSKKAYILLFSNLLGFIFAGCSSELITRKPLPENDLKNTSSTTKKDLALRLVLDSSWRCTQEGIDNICKQTSNDRPSKNIIIWTAKEKGDQDSLKNFHEHLKQPIHREIQGKAFVSEPKLTQIINIKGHDWIDSVHWQSERPNSFTRYLATVDDKIAVLVTFSSEKKDFEKFSNEIQPIIDNLKLLQ